MNHILIHQLAVVGLAAHVVTPLILSVIRHKRRGTRIVVRNGVKLRRIRRSILIPMP